MIRVPVASVRGLAVFGALTFLVSACRDDRVETLAPRSSGNFYSAAIHCEVQPGARRASCGAPATASGGSREEANGAAARRLFAARQRPSKGGTLDAVLFGGQEDLVRLTVADVRTTAAADTTRITFALQNVTSITLGTLDDATPHANGVQLFVANGPVVTGVGSSGTVTVTDTPDSASFPPYSGRLPYVQLPGLMFPGATARFAFGFSTPVTVTGFTFDLMISTELAQFLPGGGPQQLTRLAMSAEALHACVTAIDPSGGPDRAWCWGSGPGIGLADDTTSAVPLPVEGYRFTQLDSYFDARCGLTPEGLLYCWGSQALFLVTTGRSEPQPVMAGLRLRQFSMSSSHVCGVAADSTAWCQGDNSVGELGNGSTSASDLAPVRVQGGLRWREVRTGGPSTCGIAADSVAYCWGANFQGQVGDSTRTDRATPTRIAGGKKWRTLRLGTQHTCGIVVSGAVYCWGDNTSGAVGNARGTFSLVTTPDSVVLGVGVATALATGAFSTCATQGTTTKCWGVNSDGNLGNAPLGANDVPFQLATTDAFTELTATRGVLPGHTCGLAAGIARCWGANAFGQLGDQNPGANVPTPVVFQAAPLSAIDASNEHTCVIEAGANGRTLCVGHNQRGQLGRGLLGRPVPISVSKASWVTVGGSHTCVKTSFIFCWGRGDEGQLGGGSFASSQPPLPVFFSLPFHDPSGGARHTCAIRSGSTVCWGDNTSGQLGDGGFVNSATRTVVVDSQAAPGPGLASVTAGTNHSCGLDFTNAAWCWGENAQGQLGVGSFSSPRPFMARVVGGLSFLTLSAGNDVTCGVTVTHELYCWGSNNFGALGAPGPDAQQPRRIASRLLWSQVAVGHDHACALTDGGYAYCWGANVFGQLGTSGTLSFVNAAVPTRVFGDIQFTTIGAGSGLTCALDASIEQRPWCWGNTGLFGPGFAQLAGPQRIDVPVKKRQNPNGGV